MSGSVEGYSYSLRGVDVQIRKNKKGEWQQRESKDGGFGKWFGISAPNIGCYGTRIILPDYRSPVLTPLK